MGEAFKRKRAAAFKHRRHRPYQALIADDLLRLARSTEAAVEVQARLSHRDVAPAVGAQCLVREVNGAYVLIHGNMVLSTLPPEASSVLSRCRDAAPSLNGIIPCRVTRIDPFGGVYLRVEPGEFHE